MERSTTITSRLPVATRRCAEIAAWQEGKSLSAFAREAIQREAEERLLAEDQDHTSDRENEDVSAD